MFMRILKSDGNGSDLPFSVHLCLLSLLSHALHQTKIAAKSTHEMSMRKNAIDYASYIILSWFRTYPFTISVGNYIFHIRFPALCSCCILTVICKIHLFIVLTNKKLFALLGLCCILLFSASRF